MIVILCYSTAFCGKTILRNLPGWYQLNILLFYVMIALVGSGEYLPAMEPVDRYLIRLLRKPPRVVCLPTAAGREGSERIAYWAHLGIGHFIRLGAAVESLPVIDRESANDALHAEAIAGANFVYLSGGKPDYLYDTLERSLAWEAILSVLADGGILAGCSAGAMILGERFYGFPGWKQGFNFLPGVTVIPHFDEIPMSIIQPLHLMTKNKLTTLGIEGNTALVRCAEQYEVVGTGGVIVWDKSGKTRYTSGPLPSGFSGQ
jgi:cyanophycinase